MKVFGRWPKYRMFAYEQDLAVRELQSLGAKEVQAHPDGVWFVHRKPRDLVDRLTYLAMLSFGGVDVECVQHRVERVHLSTRGGQQRQATRFGVHGFHEYKGKFNPQLARGLINAVDPKARVVADPFAGSGTALIEAARLGLDAHGRDRSPMAVFLTSAKLRALLASEPADVASELTELADSVGTLLKRGQDNGSAAPVELWPPATAAYLESWFSAPAYSALREAFAAHPRAESSVAAQLSLLALSSILRTVSLQVPEDLRVRRRPDGFVAPSLRDAYLEAVDRLVLSLGELSGQIRAARVSMTLGNADDVDLFRDSPGRRLILTSPPYATALPYIDTDRLSLLALGLATPAEIRELEAALTGSREWNTPVARTWHQSLETDSHALPASVLRLLRAIESANGANGAGFRRAAVPALLYRYFVSMRADFASWRRQLRPGQRAIVVIGRNRTGPAGQQLVIETPGLLADCAAQVRMPLAAYLPLETWPRYGLHAANSVDAEDAVVLEAASR